MERKERKKKVEGSHTNIWLSWLGLKTPGLWLCWATALFLSQMTRFLSDLFTVWFSLPESPAWRRWSVTTNGEKDS